MQPRGFGGGIDRGRQALEHHANSEDRLPGAAPEGKESLAFGTQKAWGCKLCGVSHGRPGRARMATRDVAVKYGGIFFKSRFKRFFSIELASSPRISRAGSY